MITILYLRHGGSGQLLADAVRSGGSRRLPGAVRMQSLGNGAGPTDWIRLY
jgi:hypothetical protein